MPTIRISPAQPVVGSTARPAVSSVIAAWFQRRRTRLALARLDAHLLKDIGLHEATRDEEVEKPFWVA